MPTSGPPLAIAPVEDIGVDGIAVLCSVEFPNEGPVSSEEAVFAVKPAGKEGPVEFRWRDWDRSADSPAPRLAILPDKLTLSSSTLNLFCIFVLIMVS